MVPHQVSHLQGIDGDVTQGRRDVPLQGQGGLAHQQWRRRRIATCGVHPATVTAAVWPRLGRDLARIARPGQAIAPPGAKPLR